VHSIHPSYPDDHAVDAFTCGPPGEYARERATPGQEHPAFDLGNNRGHTACMTPVRQSEGSDASGASMGPAEGSRGERGGRRRRSSSQAALGRSRLAQVRLRTDELEALREVMRTLHIDSTSEALREGLHLLAREAGEVRAAEEIRAFYGDRPAPLPGGVLPPSDTELEEADEMQW